MIILLILLYLFLGIIVTAFRPTSRSILRQGFRRESQRFNKALAVLLLCVVTFVAVALWPIIWIANVRAASSEKGLLAEIKTHLIENGRNITESDEVLLTYYQFVVHQLDKVAKERGERLRSSAVKAVSLSYLAMKEDNLGFGWHVMLNRGLEIYRAEGVQALLQFLREGSSVSENKLQEAQAAQYERLKAKLDAAPNASVRYSGGDGLSFDDAIVIVGADMLNVAHAEYDYIEQRYPGYQFHQQSLKDYKGRTFDVLEFTTAAGEKKAMYFDISACYLAEHQ
jgi:hypothetical protein